MALETQTHRRMVWAMLIGAAFLLRLASLHFLPGNLDGDSIGYLILGRNLLIKHVYSIRDAPPFDPTFTRVPGYPLFIALVYFVKLDSLNAIRIAQAVIDTLTCAGVAALAWWWEFDAGRKRAAAIAAFVLAAVCPFTLRYVPAILAETLSTFFAVAMALAASRALMARKRRRVLAWWAATGIAGALGTLVRPDGGLFFPAVIATLVFAVLFRISNFKFRVSSLESENNALLCIAIAVLAFICVLAPWPIRNAVVFNRFIPLQPRHQGLPDGFVPNGYYNWLQTWIDDQRYVKPLRWELDFSQISLDQIPPKAFDSPEERARVAELLDRYNHPQSSSSEEQSGITPSGNVTARVKMTPEIDSGFAQIARERRQRDPLRFYFRLPIKRAAALWFDTHSDHYPFAGELFPIPDKSHFHDGVHSYAGYATLWIFALLVWIYTLLGAAGAWRLWQAESGDARIWVLLVAMMILPRLILFSTLDNPEPRFLVQFFPFLSVLGGIAIARVFSGSRGREEALASST